MFRWIASPAENSASAQTAKLFGLWGEAGVPNHCTTMSLFRGGGGVGFFLISRKLIAEVYAFWVNWHWFVFCTGVWIQSLLVQLHHFIQCSIVERLRCVGGIRGWSPLWIKREKDLPSIPTSQLNTSDIFLLEEFTVFEPPIRSFGIIQIARTVSFSSKFVKINVWSIVWGDREEREITPLLRRSLVPIRSQIWFSYWCDTSWWREQRTVPSDSMWQNSTFHWPILLNPNAFLLFYKPFIHKFLQNNKDIFSNRPRSSSKVAKFLPIADHTQNPMGFSTCQTQPHGPFRENYVPPHLKINK